MRAAIARRMTQSKQEAPHFYVSTEIEADALLAAASRLNDERAAEGRVTLTAFFVKATALTLQDHPWFNAVWSESTLELVDAVNIGVAIDLGDGVIAPAILGCQDLGVLEINAALTSLVDRARARRLKAAEVGAGTFTLTNLGMFDVSAFIPIIVPPQVAILALPRIEERPVSRDGQVVVRSMLTATLSADHRAVDGAAAARFLGDLKLRLQAPGPWAEVRSLA
jgi:pyruvate dehydrogenase E2 component (dihydrolipoamide acetyltransferase)